SGTASAVAGRQPSPTPRRALPGPAHVSGPQAALATSVPRALSAERIAAFCSDDAGGIGARGKKPGQPCSSCTYLMQEHMFEANTAFHSTSSFSWIERARAWSPAATAFHSSTTVPGTAESSAEIAPCAPRANDG